MGAFNDNIFKNALIILLTFNASILPIGISDVMAVNISAALFILPYFIFSAIAGQMADFLEKSQLIFKLKVTEIVLMAIGTFALFTSNIYIMWAVLFGLGTQSAFFGPLKYSILPQHLEEKELIGGNALIESGTFLAILLGTIMGGVFIVKDYGNYYIAGLIILFSFIGCISSYFIPKAEPMKVGQKINLNIFKQTIEVIKIANEKSSVFKSILAISWFWFFGATLLSQFPILVKEIIAADSSVVTMFLTIFSIGIVIGSLLCEKMSFSKVEIGLVPFGSIGMILFLFDFCSNLQSFHKLNNAGLGVFLASNGSLTILIDLFFLSIFGGLFTVPLYAFIQDSANPENRSRIIGANNIINAIFMVSSAMLAVLVSKFGGNVIDILWVLLGLHILVSIYVFSVVPLFLIRFITWLITHTTYNIKKNGLENIPENGSALIVSNHLSLIDGLLIFSAIPRPIKFALNDSIYNKFPKVFEAMGAFPLNENNLEDKEDFQTLGTIQKFLNNGFVVLYFPEKKISENGEIQNFNSALIEIVAATKTPIIYSYLDGIENSSFANKNARKNNYLSWLVKRKITYSISLPRIEENITAEKIKKYILEEKK